MDYMYAQRQKETGQKSTCTKFGRLISESTKTNKKIGEENLQVSLIKNNTPRKFLLAGLANGK